jgi:hypothetical protein
MASQQKQNPVWDNPNIDSGIGSYKIQKNPNWDMINYWMD